MLPAQERRVILATPWSLYIAKDMPSYQWWVRHGGEFPELQTVAVRVLAVQHVRETGVYI